MTLTEQLELADRLLRLESEKAKHPNELPGRYGRVVRDLERLFISIHAKAAVAGGWAVWHHGYVGRVTQDVDIVIPADCQAELLRIAPLCGFGVVEVRSGIWPKLIHFETKIDVDLMPEAGIPGTTSKPAPVAIRHPAQYGAVDDALVYISLAGLFELKLGAHRAKDIADLIELIKVKPSDMPQVLRELNQIHPAYATELQDLIVQAQQEQS